MVGQCGKQNHQATLYRNKLLSNESFTVWKIDHERLQSFHLRVGEADTHQIALHDAPDARRDCTQEVAELQIGDNLIGDLEEQLQAVFRLFAIINICPQGIPADDTSLRVPPGERAYMEPAVHAIGTTDTVLRLVWMSGFD